MLWRKDGQASLPAGTALESEGENVRLAKQSQQTRVPSFRYAILDMTTVTEARVWTYYWACSLGVHTVDDHPKKVF